MEDARGGALPGSSRRSGSPRARRRHAGRGRPAHGAALRRGRGGRAARARPAPRALPPQAGHGRAARSAWRRPAP
eukprot:13887016-Alexandrium_andersonii.AAC.1